MFPFPGAATRFSQPTTPPDRFSKIKNILSMSTYKQENQWAVGEAATRLLKDNPDLDCDIISYNDKGKIKSFLEIRGTVMVSFKDSHYSIKMNMLLPENFPQESPYMRIINPNPDFFEVDSFYHAFQSKNDPTSYLLSGLNSAKTWGTHSNVTSLLDEAKLQMGKHFPFRKKQGVQKPNRTEGTHTLPQFSKQGTQPQTHHPPPDTSYGNPTHNVPKKPTESQQKTKQILQDYASRGQVFARDSSRLADQSLNERVRDFQKIQNLEIQALALSTLTVFQKATIQEMERFVETNEIKGEVSLKDVVVPLNNLAASLLDSVCSYKAASDSIIYIQNFFSNGSIPLETFLKLIRRVQEERFMAKTMMAKLTKQVRGC